MANQGKHAAREEVESAPSLISPDLIPILWRRKWYLIAPVIISVALGTAYLLQLEPTYRIQARVLVQRQGLAPGQERKPKDDEEFLATQAEIIRSPAVVQRAANTLDLAPRGDPQMDPTTIILDCLTVKPVLGTSVLSITMVGPDAEEATRTVAAVIASYRKYLYHIDHETHLESLRVLTRSERELRDDLDGLEQQYLQLRESSALMGRGRDAAAVQRALLTHLGETMTDAKNHRMQVENRIRAWLHPAAPAMASQPPAKSVLFQASLSSVRGNNRRSGSPSAMAELQLRPSAISAAGGESLSTFHLTDKDSGINVADIRLIRQELFRTQAQQQALAQQYGPKHPEMRAVREKTVAWQRRLKEAMDETPRIMQQQLEAARLQERQLAHLYQAEFEKAKAVDGHLIKEQQVTDRIERVQSIHDSILGQVRQWQLADQALAEGRSGVRIGILEAPALAERVMFPPPLLLLAVCIVIGLVGGSAMITIVESTDTKVQSPQQVQARLKHPVLGRIPVISAPRRGIAKPLYRGRAVRLAPDSRVAEAFRAMRTRMAIDSNGSGGRVIQLASSREGEGKTTVAANLAFSFAQLGKKVLVIDADLRNGKLHNVFDVTNSTGLTSVLRGRTSIEDAVRQSPLAKVDLLARGPDVTNPAELLAQPKLEEVLQWARGKYDLVLLDTSPLLAVTEPSVLAPKVDGVLLSTVIRRSSVVEARRACELLETLEAKILGIVVNQVPMERRTGSYYEAPASAAAAGPRPPEDSSVFGPGGHAG